MKNILLQAICFVVIALFSSCNAKDDTTVEVDQKDSTTLGVWNDYLPLNVGAKSRYKYLDQYIGTSGVYKKKVGECTWNFESASTDEGNVHSDSTTNIPVVYVVRQSFTGFCITGSTKKDTVQVENEISTLSFKVATDYKVTFSFKIPYFANRTWIFDRYVQSEKTTICHTYQAPENRLCLKKNVGITSICNTVTGNNKSYIQYDLIDGPYY
jgi:hypothetical protein